MGSPEQRTGWTTDLQSKRNRRRWNSASLVASALKGNKEAQKKLVKRATVLSALFSSIFLAAGLKP